MNLGFEFCNNHEEMGFWQGLSLIFSSILWFFKVEKLWKIIKYANNGNKRRNDWFNLLLTKIWPIFRAIPCQKSYVKYLIHHYQRLLSNNGRNWSLKPKFIKKLSICWRKCWNLEQFSGIQFIWLLMCTQDVFLSFDIH